MANITSGGKFGHASTSRGHLRIDFFAPLRSWLNHIDFHRVRFARLVCKLVPPSCPFERDVTLFGRLLFHIPALCKLNPLYEELIGLRFRAMTFLADVCGEDITPYLS